jgi:hypothetical protein
VSAILPIFFFRSFQNIYFLRHRLETLLVADSKQFNKHASAYVAEAKLLGIEHNEVVLFLVAAHSILSSYFPPEKDSTHWVYGPPETPTDAEEYTTLYSGYGAKKAADALRCVTPYDISELTLGFLETTESVGAAVGAFDKADHFRVFATPQAAKLAMDLWLCGVDFRAFNLGPGRVAWPSLPTISLGGFLRDYLLPVNSLRKYLSDRHLVSALAKCLVSGNTNLTVSERDTIRAFFTNNSDRTSHNQLYAIPMENTRRLRLYQENLLVNTRKAENTP